MRKFFNIFKYIGMPAIAAILIIFDRLLKSLAVNNFFYRPVNLAGDFFRLDFASNYNVAFSLPFTGISVKIAVSLILAALIAYLIILFKKAEYNKTILLLIIILGAASNLYDRFKYGFVIDYFDLKYFTVFNLADVLIIGSFIGFLILEPKYFLK